MKRSFTVLNVLFVLWIALFCFQAYFGAIHRSDLVHSQQRYFSIAVNSAFSICLLMIGVFCVMPKSLRYHLLSNSWFQKHKDVLIRIFAPGLGLWAWLSGILILVYVLYWSF